MARGRRSTPRTTLKMAALAPMPSASVRTTVRASPLTRPRDRSAKRRSVMKLISLSLLVERDPFRSTSAAGYFLRKASRLHGPGPAADKYRNMKQ